MTTEKIPLRYELTREAWIPIATRDGGAARVSLRDAFARAHEWRGIEHPIPIIELGVWRLLIAIATDVLDLRDVSELAELLERGRFDAERFERYFDELKGRFDLFDATQPFLQHASATGELKPLSAISPIVPSGTNTVHWHKRSEEAFGACARCSALLLTTIAPAMTAGGAGLSPSINGAPPYYCLLRGANLFECIVFNIWAAAPKSIRGEAPAWRTDRPPNPKMRATRATLLQAYSWQPRTINLQPGEAGECSLCSQQTGMLVRSMYFSKGDSCDFADWRDPNVAYVSTKQNTSPLRPRGDRSPWRDVDALLLLPERSASSRRLAERPRIVSQFAELRDESSNAMGPMAIRMIGLRTDLKMKAFEWMAEDLVLPLPIAPNERAYNSLVRAVATADAISRALGIAITNATRRDSFDHRDLARALAVPAQRRYWGALDARFRDFAAAVARRDPAPALDHLQLNEEYWNADCARAARSAFQSAVDRLARNAEQLIATERARAGLDRYLASVVAPSPKALAGDAP